MLLQISTKLYFLTSVLIGFIKCSSDNYIYAELDRNLEDKEGFNFSLITKNSSGIILYAVDSKSVFLIEIENNNIQIKFQNYRIEKSLGKICGFYIDRLWKFVVRLNRLKVNIECNGKFNSLNFYRKHKKENYTSYPKPKGLYENIQNSYIWMGNIGDYKGMDNEITVAMKNQIFGCLGKFYFRKKRINYFSNATKFSKQCSNFYNESICYNETNCQENVTPYEIDDCSLSSMNGRYCKPSYQVYSSHLNSFYRTGKHNKVVYVKLYWKSFLENYFCLLELESSKDSFATIFINQHSQMLLALKHPYKTVLFNRLINITDETDLFILVKINLSELTVKIFNNDRITVFVTSLNFDPISITVGTSQNSGICQTFEGLIDIQYDPTQFTHGLGFWKLFFIVGGILLVPFVGVIIITFLKVKNKNLNLMNSLQLKLHLNFKKTCKTNHQEEGLGMYSTVDD